MSVLSLLSRLRNQVAAPSYAKVEKPAVNVCRRINLFGNPACQKHGGVLLIGNPHICQLSLMAADGAGAEQGGGKSSAFPVVEPTLEILLKNHNST